MGFHGFYEVLAISVDGIGGKLRLCFELKALGQIHLFSLFPMIFIKPRLGDEKMLVEKNPATRRALGWIPARRVQE